MKGCLVVHCIPFSTQGGRDTNWYFNTSSDFWVATSFIIWKWGSIFQVTDRGYLVPSGRLAFLLRCIPSNVRGIWCRDLWPLLFVLDFTIWRIRAAFERIIAYGDPAKKSRVLAARKSFEIQISTHWLLKSPQGVGGRLDFFFINLFMHTYIHHWIHMHIYIHLLLDFSL